MVNKHLEEYVNLQIQLAQVFQDEFGQVNDKFLVNIPKDGEIRSEGLIWHFQKHGSGVIFTENTTKIKVDINEMSIDPSFFDQWRLRTYLGSLGRRGVEFISSITGKTHVTLDENIQEWFSILLKNGKIEKVNNYYRIKK